MLKARLAVGLLILATIPLAVLGEGCGGDDPAAEDAGFDGSRDGTLYTAHDAPPGADTTSKDAPGTAEDAVTGPAGCGVQADCGRVACASDGKSLLECRNTKPADACTTLYGYVWVVKQVCAQTCTAGACQ